MTGSGKTFTINGATDQSGVVISTVKHLLAERTHANDLTMSASFFEIYCDNVVDLLAAEGERSGIVVVGLQLAKIDDFSPISSAHTGTDNVVVRGLHSRTESLTQCSENNKRRGNKGSSSRSRVRLACRSSRSVKSLTLNQGSTRVPYRECNPTRILQDSLGGGANALLIACVAGSTQFATETLSTLQFAAKSRKIANNPVVNRDTSYRGTWPSFGPQRNLVRPSTLKRSVGNPENAKTPSFLRQPLALRWTPRSSCRSPPPPPPPPNAALGVGEKCSREAIVEDPATSSKRVKRNHQLAQVVSMEPPSLTPPPNTTRLSSSNLAQVVDSAHLPPPSSSAVPPLDTTPMPIGQAPPSLLAGFGSSLVALGSSLTAPALSPTVIRSSLLSAASSLTALASSPAFFDLIVAASGLPASDATNATYPPVTTVSVLTDFDLAIHIISIANRVSAVSVQTEPELLC
ncbi:hypothetical protein AMAG_14901 [Allomyces macrogynus ATCC 38327]|uniref:Kinesin motor domain-containing protein n=1 Tax=Allomyces macrogynus (strain ATCC 38327) TaxID=578462 RepID=A0A0L0T7Q4_ALLM3|nr:hypothetical protein AMAG_14901 [Allomyces macrogynus ATCC 38327]|eukprot:KNE70777.1 hypothetical protein AMAG_14901 [Allomyces macrogynus ATCC 38327]